MFTPFHIDLPRDMLNEILSYLSIKDLASLRQSCQFFQRSLLDYLSDRLKEEAVVQIIAQWRHTFLLKKNGTVWACGSNLLGQLGIKSHWVNELTQISFPAKIRKIVGAYNHTFFLTNDGRVFACGEGSSWIPAKENGWLGRVLPMTKGRIEIPVPIQTPAKVKDIIVSYLSTFLLLENNTILACGVNSHGQLAIGDVNDYQATPVPILLKNVKQVCSDDKNTFFILNDGSVWGCGENFQGSLGLGDKIPHLRPEKLSNLPPVKEIVQNSWRTIFILSNGDLMFSGSKRKFIDNIEYLGDKEANINLTPVAVPGKVKQIVDGTHFMIVLLEGGNAYACGDNSQGQLGLGDFNPRANLEKIPLNQIKKIYQAQQRCIFALEDGSVWGCGTDRKGELGTRYNTSPTRINLPNKVKDVSMGDGHIVFLLADDTVWSSGNNSHGQLGYKNYLGSSTTPQLIPKVNQWHLYLNAIKAPKLKINEQYRYAAPNG